MINENKRIKSLLANALSIITLEPRLKEWLEKNDPKALEQAKFALNEYNTNKGSV